MNTKYEEFNWKNENSHPLIPFINNNIRDGDVLEVGCGNGMILKTIQDNGINAEGFDISEIAVMKARQNGAKNVIVSSISNFITEKKYDYIICFSTLYYLRAFEYDFWRLSAMLKTNGKLIVNFINPIRKKDKWTCVSFKEFKQAIRNNKLTIERVIPQSIWTGGINCKYLTRLNVYVLRK